jgi:hypothetical protein
VLRSILEVLAHALHDQGYLDLQEAFIDGSFAPAKQGGARVGKTKRGKGSKVISPNSPSAGVIVAFIKVAGAPVELLQIDRTIRSDL